MNSIIDKLIGDLAEMSGIDSNSLVESMPANKYELPSFAAHLEAFNNHIEIFCHLQKQKINIHEITITFKPKYHDYNNLHLYSYAKDSITKWFRDIMYFKPNYLFVPEFTQMGILHFHGLLYIDNGCDYWVNETKRRFQTKFGRTKGKEIYSLHNYIKYILKDLGKSHYAIKPFGYHYQTISLEKDKNLELNKIVLMSKQSKQKTAETYALDNLIDLLIKE